MVVEYLNEEFNNYCYTSSSQICKVKTCTCSVGKDACPLHVIERNNRDQDNYFRHDSKCSDISLNSNSYITESSVTVIPKNINPEINPKVLMYDELKLSLSSLTSEKDNVDKDKEKEIAFERWVAEKDRQRKRDIKKQEDIQKFIEDEKEKKLELERQNFSAWLKTKRDREKHTQKQIEKQKKYEERKIREEKESKQKLAKMKLKLWMKQKEESLLVNKMQEQISKIKAKEEKQKRMEESMQAYELWLKNSKNKPKPVPSNRGLESLKTSVSVSFINPTPWNPNIEKENTVSK